jgi:hypothetical protein
MKLKLLFHAVAILAVLASITAKSQSQSNNQFVGTYSYSFSFGGSSITLNPDHTFQQHDGSCTFTTQQNGTYTFADGKLQFTISKYTGKQNSDGKEVDLFDPKLRREFYGYSGDTNDEPLKKQFVLYPISWGQRMYLIDEAELGRFADAVNLGLEPREFSPQDRYFGTFLLREGDEGKKTNGVPSLPSQYRDRLVSEPITVTIVSVEEADKEQIATIDKGRLAGVRTGLRFIAKDQEPEPWSNDGVVLSVEDTSAKVRVSNRVVGEVLTTKFERKDRFQ